MRLQNVERGEFKHLKLVVDALQMWVYIGEKTVCPRLIQVGEHNLAAGRRARLQISGIQRKRLEHCNQYDQESAAFLAKIQRRVGAHFVQQTTFIQVAECKMTGCHSMCERKHLSRGGEPISFLCLLDVSGTIHVVPAGNHVPQKSGLVAVEVNKRIEDQALAQLGRFATVPQALAVFEHLGNQHREFWMLAIHLRDS
jgi:hypothetical protein